MNKLIHCNFIVDYKTMSIITGNWMSFDKNPVLPHKQLKFMHPHCTFFAVKLLYTNIFPLYVPMIHSFLFNNKNLCACIFIKLAVPFAFSCGVLYILFVRSLDKLALKKGALNKFSNKCSDINVIKLA